MESPARMARAPALAIKTERLMLRPIVPADAAETAGLMNDRLAGQLIGWSNLATIADIEERIRRGERERAARAGLDLAILGRFDRALRGWIEFRTSAPAELELSFWLGSEHQGRGFAAEALRAAIPATVRMLGARSLSALVFADNEVAIRILRRLGMHEGRAVRRRPDRHAAVRFQKDLCGIL